MHLIFYHGDRLSSDARQSFVTSDDFCDLCVEVGRTTRRVKAIYFRQIKENRLASESNQPPRGEERNLFNLTCSCKSKSPTRQRVSLRTEECDSWGRLRSFNKIPGSTLSKLESGKVPLVGNVSAGTYGTLLA